ncbi:MAG TPA: NADP-dependent oxidoreductase [Bordetella sp.]
MPSNLQVRFVKPPAGWVDEDCFAFHEAEIPEPAEGEIVVRNVWLSIDPYQRRQMMPGVQYAQPLLLGGVMVGRTMGRVVRSRSSAYREGDWVRGSLGWQQYSLGRVHDLEKIELDGIAPSAYLGVLGSPGITAWVGLREVAKARAGETVVVSAAAGAVGSVAGQLARATGCRTVGIAGGALKCGLATGKFGFDACVDYKDARFGEQLAEAAPGRIDVDFENVGGPIFDQVLQHLNDGARIALCGLVSQYNLVEPYGMKHIGEILNRNAALLGFRVTHYPQCREAALGELKQRLKAGELYFQESVAHGLRSAPAAFVGVLRGTNIGKQVVKIADDA